MKVQSLLSVANTNIFFSIDGIVSVPVHVKCEALNATGSIKLKPALRMIEDLERAGKITKGSTIIESSSGNLGVALSMIAAAKGYRFVCVTDPNASKDSVKSMRATGAEVIIVEIKDCNNGYLGSRIKLIETMCRDDPSMIWLNQYANESNWLSHLHSTGPEILTHFPRVDCLFIGTGSGGTLMGCARYFRSHSPSTRLIAVEPEGSVTFGAPSKQRWIPGIGTSKKPAIVDNSLVGSVIYVPEFETIRMCREIARCGLLVGGSTGTVLAGVKRFAAEIKSNDVVVAVMPDLGFKYLDTIYCDDWVERHFGDLDLSGDSRTG